MSDKTRRRDIADDVQHHRITDPRVMYGYHANEIVIELKKDKPDYAKIQYHRRGMSFARAMTKNLSQKAALNAMKKKFFG